MNNVNFGTRFTSANEANEHIAKIEAELADERKKVNELEAAIVGWKEDQRENMMIATEEHQRANNAEQQLAAAQATIANMLEALADSKMPHNAELKRGAEAPEQTRDA